MDMYAQISVTASKVFLKKSFARNNFKQEFCYMMPELFSKIINNF